MLPDNLFNKDEPFYSIGKKWIKHAQQECDTNDIAAAVWAAIKDTRNALGAWKSTAESLPPDETPVYIIRNGELRLGVLLWETPNHEDNYKAFQYWDDPNDDGQLWEHNEVTHWKAFSIDDEIILDAAFKKYNDKNV